MSEMRNNDIALARDPAEPFIILKHDVPKLHRIRRAVDFEVLKLRKDRSGNDKEAQINKTSILHVLHILSFNIFLRTCLSLCVCTCYFLF